MLGNLSLEKVVLMAEFKIAERDAPLKERWLPEDRTTLASLPGTLEEVLKNTNMVKSAASKFMSWLLPGQKFGERYFPGWFHKVDTALFVQTSSLMPGLKDTEELCLQDIIDFKELKNMKSLSNGNISAIKKESKVKSWSGFMKILLEWGVIIMNVEEAVPKEKNKEKELISRNEEQNKTRHMKLKTLKMNSLKKLQLKKLNSTEKGVRKKEPQKTLLKLRSLPRKGYMNKGQKTKVQKARGVEQMTRRIWRWLFRSVKRWKGTDCRNLRLNCLSPTVNLREALMM